MSVAYALLMIISTGTMSTEPAQVTFFPNNTTIRMDFCRRLEQNINSQRINGVKATCIPTSSE